MAILVLLAKPADAQNDATCRFVSFNTPLQNPMNNHQQFLHLLHIAI